MGAGVRRVSIGLVLALGLALVLGTLSARRAGDDSARGTAAAATGIATAPERHPLTAGPTPEPVQLAIFERAYSECASTELTLLASKYKAADRSPRGVAGVVGRAWASYFRAGRDAVRDGRDGCLQGQRDRSS